MTTPDAPLVSRNHAKELILWLNQPGDCCLSVIQSLEALETILALYNAQEENARYRLYFGCPACGERHDEADGCSPHEVRTTGQAWFRQALANADARVEQLERDRDKEKTDAAMLLSHLRECRAISGHMADQMEALEAERDAALEKVASVQSDCINAMCPWCRSGHEALAPTVKADIRLGWHHAGLRGLGGERIEECKAAEIWAMIATASQKEDEDEDEGAERV